MNKAILNTEIQTFIKTNLKSDITKLILKGSPFEYVSIQEIAAQIIAKNKCEKKLPTWFSRENIYYPNKLNIEQTSSEITANYKANLVSGETLIDITGGLGVDTFCFAQKIKNVTHCEINKNLSQLVSYNFKQLNIQNIQTIIGDGLEILKNSNIHFDWIYADPSRRNDVKGKVFLLDDCLPNIPQNLELFFQKTNNVLLKVSPILDISSAINELRYVKEIHIIAVENEVKELLFILEKSTKQQIEIKTININKKKQQYFNFTFQEEATATYAEPKEYLYEPNAAILKASGFSQISEQIKIDKLHPNSHLYTSNELIDFPGRRFKIKHNIPYNKKQLQNLVPSKKANITTRNFPNSVAEIRKKIGLKDGGNQYVFFTTDLSNKSLVIICEKL